MTTTNEKINELLGLESVKVDDVLSIKEQRTLAKSNLESSNPEDLESLYNSLKSKGFAVSFSDALYRSFEVKKREDGSTYHKKTEWLEGGEDAYNHARIMFGFIQTLAIRYKKASLILDADVKTGKNADAAKTAKSAFFDGWKMFRDEIGITAKCKAGDADAIAAFAAKFTFKTANIADGVKYSPAAITTFAMAMMRYIAAESEGMDVSIEAIQRRQQRLMSK